MGNQQPFRAAPAELGGMGDAFFKHFAPNGAPNPPPRRASFSTKPDRIWAWTWHALALLKS